ncbi:porin family protein, partial [Vibrio anguillarum]|nr:porin family protein [Vibrio anguillarum]MBF4296863.1 porin family protein [Vibrio anguillarum]MBF4354466.1 porin family protein [Vibrio anguillarum]
LIVKKWPRLIAMHQYNKVILIIGSLSAPYAQAQVIVSPFFGYTLGGEVVDKAGNDYDLKASSSYGLAIET